MLASTFSGLGALLLAGLAAAQTPESACRSSNGSQPFDGMYREAARPQIHFSPSSGFMNDPNGMFIANGTHHLYYQYNPNSTVAGNQHWGHATSPDGYEWTNQEIALAPEREGQGIFSGSAVIDVNNTSGFFDGTVAAETRIVAIYTLNTPTEQTQDIAYSRDGGYTFTKYEGNPVISINSTQFRDPKVFWDAQAQLWVMAVAHTQSWEIGFYTSPDLKTWEERSRFSSGLRGYQYECPDLIEVPVQGGPHDGQRAKVLVVSINPGAPLGGSVTQYFIGDLNSGSDGFEDFTFRTNDTAVRFTSFGKDEYAAQSFYNSGDEGAIYQAWLGNWQYAQAVPTANATSGWRSEQSLPRRLRLEWVQQNPQTWAYVLAQEPLSFGSLAGTDLAPSNVSGNTTVALNGTGAFDVRALFSLPANATVEPRANLRIRTQGEGFLDIGADWAGDGATVFVDRRKAGTEWADTNHFFTDRMSASLMPVPRVANDSSSDSLIEVRVVIDRIVSEAYYNNGTSVAAVLTFWDNDEVPSFVDVTTSSSQLKLESLSVVPIASGWKC